MLIRARGSHQQRKTFSSTRLYLRFNDIRSTITGATRCGFKEHGGFDSLDSDVLSLHLEGRSVSEQGSHSSLPLHKEERVFRLDLIISY